MEKYVFNEVEWEYLLKLYNRYKSTLTAILEDTLKHFFELHAEDNSVVNEVEVLLLMRFLKNVKIYWQEDEEIIIDNAKPNVSQENANIEEIEGILANLLEIVRNLEYQRNLKKMGD